MELGYDPEAIYQDADIEMAELQERARHLEALEKKGICRHGGLQGNPDGTVTCKKCGKVFPDSETAYRAHEEYL